MKGVKEYAILKHGEQRYGDEPYVYHLLKVVSLVQTTPSCTMDLLAAAWLHDALEDTDATEEEILALTNPRVLEIVKTVTDKPGKNRRARHEATYPGIALDRDATILKVCDRLANVTHSIMTKDVGKFRMYKKELPYFKSCLANPDDPEITHYFDLLDKLMAGGIPS